MLKSKGIYFALSTAIISGLAIFFNKFAVKAIGKDPYQFTTLKNLVVALGLALIVLSPKVLPKLKNLTKGGWLFLFSIAVVGGSVPFLLFFKGLSLASSTSAAFIHKTLFVWVTFLALIFLKEKVTKLQFFALGCLLAGTWLLDGFSSMNFGRAELYILLATLLWSGEYIIAKKALKNIDSLVLAWARMFFGVIIMFGFLSLTGRMGGIFDFGYSGIAWLILSCLLLFGYVTTWYKALKYEKATVMTCVLVFGSLITTMLNSVFVSHALSVEKILGGLIIGLGILAFNRAKSPCYQRELKLIRL